MTTRKPEFIEPTVNEVPDPETNNGTVTLEIAPMPVADDFPVSPSVVDLDKRLAAVEARLDALTAAVNQFGAMLQHIVNTVSQAGQALSSQGIGGLMSLMGGGKNG